MASRVVLEKKLKIPPNSVVQTGALMKPKGTGEMVIVPGSDNKGVIFLNMLVKADEIIPIYKLLMIKITLYINTEVMSLDMLLSLILFYRMRDLAQ